jgi:hypothetical protein
MSRSNPLKKKKRQANKTFLVLGEGLSEEMFLKHLKSLYYVVGVAITIRKGKGGTPNDVVICAHKTPGAFDRKIVIIDNDKSKAEMQKARTEAKRRGIEILENTPCLEWLLLSILDEKIDGDSSNRCKNKFESKYISKKKRSEPEEYVKLFPKNVLDKKRTKIKELERFIVIMEGK